MRNPDRGYRHSTVLTNMRVIHVSTTAKLSGRMEKRPMPARDGSLHTRLQTSNRRAECGRIGCSKSRINGYEEGCTSTTPSDTHEYVCLPVRTQVCIMMGKSGRGAADRCRATPQLWRQAGRGWCASPAASRSKRPGSSIHPSTPTTGSLRQMQLTEASALDAHLYHRSTTG